MNKLSLIGNLGQDPKIKEISETSKVANFSIATTERYKNRAGNEVENTEWHSIVAWNGLAGVVEKHLKKGDRVYIEGKLFTEKWTDGEGTERTTHKVRLDRLEFLGNRREAVLNGTAKPTTTKENKGKGKNNVENEGNEVVFEAKKDDDLPF